MRWIKNTPDSRPPVYEEVIIWLGDHWSAGSLRKDIHSSDIWWRDSLSNCIVDNEDVAYWVNVSSPQVEETPNG